ncbi:MAG: nuclear transport factor 2 family protein [Clostridia bacterium]|nr:nuclear transport factor 2 family protein [Clostridia bacterium]
MNLHAYWEAALKQRRDELAACFAPDAIIRWHCTGEMFTVEEFIRANCDYPGEWDGCVERAEQTPAGCVTAVRVWPADRSASYHAVSFFTLKNGLIAALDEYWADDGEPPAWRQEMGIGRPIIR